MEKTSKITVSNSNDLYTLRIIAAWSVLLGHSFSYYQVSCFKNQLFFPYIQNIAVIVFFILSGFFTEASFEREDLTFREYIWGRFIRIYSFFLPCILLVILIDKLNIFCFPLEYSFYEDFKLGVFVQNIILAIAVNSRTFGSAKPLWTLGIEWVLYLSYGYYVLVFKRKYSSGSMPIAYIFLLGILSYIPLIHLNGFGHQPYIVFAFFCGVFLWRVYKIKVILTDFQKKCLLCISLFIFGFASFYNKEAYCLMEVLAITLFIFSLLVVRKNKKGENRRNRILKKISGYTYPLYLLHYSIIDILYNYNNFCGGAEKTMLLDGNSMLKYNCLGGLYCN